MAVQDSDLENLRFRWKEMFTKKLPAAATTKSAAQPKWPVHVDHCFARIILDATVGIDTPWMSKVKSPAYKNMSKEQLEACINLGQQILDGEADLVELDSSSLELRGQGKGMSGKASGKISSFSSAKRKRDEDERAEENRKAPKIAHDSSPAANPGANETSLPKTLDGSKTFSKEESDDLTLYLKKIALSQKTSFQKKVLSVLCQVPRGRYTTYAAISKHLSSSPRAVGNALKNNPFAPQVPCHRVLASGGGLGGFMGSWGRNGMEGLNDDKKRKLLRDENVKFDGRGRVVGTPWEGFK